MYIEIIVYDITKRQTQKIVLSAKEQEVTWDIKNSGTFTNGVSRVIVNQMHRKLEFFFIMIKKLQDFYAFD